MGKAHKSFRDFLADQKKMTAEIYLEAVEEMLKLEHSDYRLDGMRGYKEDCGSIRRIGLLYAFGGVIGLPPSLELVIYVAKQIIELVTRTIPNTTSLLGIFAHLIWIIWWLVVGVIFLNVVIPNVCRGFSLLSLYGELCSLTKKGPPRSAFRARNSKRAT